MLARSQKGVLLAALLAVICAFGGFIAVAGGEPPPKDYGPAPDFAGIEEWLNSEPLSMAELRGKVVLINFWTYSCINCLRALPHITKWHKTYKDGGLLVVGVHTPEFAFERRTRNVQTAIQRLGIEYPVAQDNRYATWTAYGNRYWPAEYLIDREGRIVLRQFGEGRYDEMENAIRKLVGAGPPVAKEDAPNVGEFGSPEMYFGAPLLRNLASPEKPRKGEQVYSAPAKLPLDTFALVGSWTLDDESATLSKDDGEIVLRFRAAKVHMVASSPSPVTVSLIVDGQLQPPVIIEDSRLYTLFISEDHREHLLKLDVPKAGLSVFTFTFG